MFAVACGSPHDLAFHGGGQRVICSQSIDDHLARVPWNRIEWSMRSAEIAHTVLAFHGHGPGVSRDAVEHLFALAEAHHLAPLTYRELGEAHGPGFLLAFDDMATDAWLALDDVFANHHAHVTFFVTRWPTMSQAQHAAIHQLADAGHDIEPHGVNHLHAPAYATEHGIAAYIRDEVLPSIAALRDAGFAPATTFAYPFGEHTTDLDAALLEHVPFVRVTTSECP